MGGAMRGEREREVESERGERKSERGERRTMKD